MCFEKQDVEFARVCKERDDLKKENAELKEICEKQAVMNGRLAAMSLELDEVKAERDALREKLEGKNG